MGWLIAYTAACAGCVVLGALYVDKVPRPNNDNFWDGFRWGWAFASKWAGFACFVLGVLAIVTTGATS